MGANPRPLPHSTPPRLISQHPPACVPTWCAVGCWAKPITPSISSSILRSLALTPICRWWWWRRLMWPWALAHTQPSRCSGHYSRGQWPPSQPRPDYRCPEYAGLSGMRIRGSSSGGFPKKQYSMDLWNDYVDSEIDASLLGLPTESDWILHAPGRSTATWFPTPLPIPLPKPWA